MLERGGTSERKLGAGSPLDGREECGNPAGLSNVGGRARRSTRVHAAGSARGPRRPGPATELASLLSAPLVVLHGRLRHLRENHHEMEFSNSSYLTVGPFESYLRINLKEN